MEITCYTSHEVRTILQEKLEYKFQMSTGIVPLLNDVYYLNEINKSDTKSLTIKDIEISKDAFVFDILEELQDLVKVDEMYFSQKYFKKYKDNFTIQKNSLIKRENLDLNIFKEAYKVFLNKLIRGVHTSKIIFLDIEFESNNNLQSEIDIANKYNLILKKYVEIIKELSPGINTLHIKCGLNFNNDEINYILKDDTNSKINTILKNSKKFSGEKIYPSLYPIKYCFEKANLFNKNKLIIVFSAFSSQGAKYNYRTTLKFVDCNKLFILDDFATRGSYYLGINGDFNIESSVVSLITEILSNNNIEFKDVIMVGSSKGGTAALYYGLKYNFGNIITGAPQYKIGSYLSDLSVKQYANDIFGDINDANRIRYDNIIRMSCRQGSKANIFMLTSDGDRQYKKVLREFENVSEEYNLNLMMEKCEIKNHAEISTAFPPFLNEKIKLILKNGCFDNKLTDRVIKKVTELKYKLDKR